MADKKDRRRFGSVRELPSGRWQVRYRGPDGRMRNGRETYESKVLAERALVVIEGQMIRGDWTDPARAKIRLSDYAERWITERPGLRPRTMELYQGLFRKHLAPYLGGVRLDRLSTSLIREWRAKLVADGVSENVAAKTYRLLRAIMNTAVNQDHLLHRNPCSIPGADREYYAERPVLSVDEVLRLLDEVADRYRALVLVAAFASLRYGELTALERCDIDTGAAAIRVRQSFSNVQGKGLVLGPPKSQAGRRTVPIPKLILPELRTHLRRYVGEEPSALVFTGPKGKPISRSNFRKLVGWKEAVAKIGRPGLHFHDLRHTGNHFAARSGVSTRDLMIRMGHDSMRAALIYQHATSSAGQQIAKAMDDEVRKARRGRKRKGKADEHGAG